MSPRTTALLTIGFVHLAFTPGVAPDGARRAAARPYAAVDAAAVSRQALGAYRHLPLAFETNHGQVDSRVKFLARSRGATVFLTPDETVVVLGGRDNRPSVLRMKLLGALKHAVMSGEGRLAGNVNYIVGADRSKWRSGVTLHASVRAHDVYWGVDVIFYGKPGELEHDFVVSPRGDPQAIRFLFEGAAARMDAAGDLVLSLAAGELLQRKPHVYQDVNGIRTEIGGRYVERDGGIGAPARITRLPSPCLGPSRT